MGTHMKVLNESFQVNTWQDLDEFRKMLSSCALDESSLSIERVKGTDYSEGTVSRVVTCIGSPLISHQQHKG